jgi:hypothetical protein
MRVAAMACEAQFRAAVAEGPPDPERFTVLTLAEWHELGEYSCSLPSGTIVGKRWKRNLDAYASKVTPPRGWLVGEYYDVGSTTEIGIRWTKPIIV